MKKFLETSTENFSPDERKEIWELIKNYPFNHNSDENFYYLDFSIKKVEKFHIKANISSVGVPFSKNTSVGRRFFVGSTTDVKILSKENVLYHKENMRWKTYIFENKEEAWSFFNDKREKIRKEELPINNFEINEILKRLPFFFNGAWSKKKKMPVLITTRDS